MLPIQAARSSQCHLFPAACLFGGGAPYRSLESQMQLIVVHILMRLGWHMEHIMYCRVWPPCSHIMATWRLKLICRLHQIKNSDLQTSIYYQQRPPSNSHWVFTIGMPHSPWKCPQASLTLSIWHHMTRNIPSWSSSRCLQVRTVQANQLKDTKSVVKQCTVVGRCRLICMGHLFSK